MPDPPQGLRPMTDFNPSEPAILHDKRTNLIATWIGEDAAAYKEAAVVRSDGAVEWKDFVFDGWGNMLDG
jgi:hypothetical protein